MLMSLMPMLLIPPQYGGAIFRAQDFRRCRAITPLFSLLIIFRYDADMLPPFFSELLRAAADYFRFRHAEATHAFRGYYATPQRADMPC